MFILSCFSSVSKYDQSRSTLFPYTTLFRSLIDVGVLPEVIAEWFGAESTTPGRFGCGGVLRIACSSVSERLRGMRDRKSTRLNSSHRCISYAVFCLKKKSTYYSHVFGILYV